MYKRQGDKFTTCNLLKTKVSLDFDGGRYERMVADTAGYVTVAKADRIWDELMQIALREVGLADPYAVEQVHSLRKIKETTEIYNPAGGGMHCLCFVQAIRYLCACGRDDSLEAVAKEIRGALDGGAQPVIPDFCYDHHTRLGVEWGRTPLDFLDPDGGSKVVPALEGVAEPYICLLYTSRCV